MCMCICVCVTLYKESARVKVKFELIFEKREKDSHLMRQNRSTSGVGTTTVSPTEGPPCCVQGAEGK